jgi:hypothetical protein
MRKGIDSRRDNYQRLGVTPHVSNTARHGAPGPTMFRATAGNSRSFDCVRTLRGLTPLRMTISMGVSDVAQSHCPCSKLKAVQPLPLYRFFTSILRGSYLDVKPYWYWYWRSRMASRIACFETFTLHLTLGTTGVAI